MQKTVGISEMLLTGDAEDVLVTFSLGSCVALSLYDPAVRVGGLIHCMLPLSRTNPEKAAKHPFMFTDTGVTTMLEGIFNMGARRRNLIAKVIGGASRVAAGDIFEVGKRNYTVLRKILWKNNILIAAEDVGGPTSRTVFLHIGTGQTFVKSDGKTVEL